MTPMGTHASDEQYAALLESGQAVLIDNSCIINAINVMRPGDKGERSLNIYQIMDLETFFRAFLFHERMTTLVGYSFLAGASSDDEAVSSYYEYLMDAHLLVPLVVPASQFNSHLAELDVLDDGASLIDVSELRNVVNEVFGPLNPWLRQTDKNLPQRMELLFGKGAVVADSFPVYEFRSGRKRSWEDVFLSQTYHYVVMAGLRALPYLASSVRTPLVARLADALDRHFVDVAGASLAAVGSAVTAMAEAALEFFGGHSLHIFEYPALLAVLLEASAAEVNLASALDRVRRRPDVAAYRSWCGLLARAWARQDIAKVALAMSQMREAASQVSVALNTGVLEVPVQRLPNVQATSRRAGLSFATTISYAMADSGTASELLEKHTGYRLTTEDYTIAQRIFAERNRFSSKGEPHQYWASPARMEVIMGDKFENISESTIINRSVLQNSLNQIENRDTALASALNLIAQELEKLKNAEAAANLEALSEELGRGQPRKPILRSLWDGLVAAAPSVLSLTQAVATVVATFS